MSCHVDAAEDRHHSAVTRPVFHVQRASGATPSEHVCVLTAFPSAKAFFCIHSVEIKFIHQDIWADITNQYTEKTQLILFANRYIIPVQVFMLTLLKHYSNRLVVF